MKTRILITALIILFLGALSSYTYYGYRLPSRQKQQQLQEVQKAQSSKNTVDVAKNSGGNNFGLEGQVVSVSDKEIGLAAKIIRDGKEVPLNKSYSIDNFTNYRFQTNGKITNAKLSDVKVGETVSVSSFQYPFDENEVYAFYVTILK